MIGDAHRTVSWKRYLLETDEPRILKFLESRGNEVFYQISIAINAAVVSNKDSIVLLIHPNMKNVIRIKKEDFITVLDRICSLRSEVLFVIFNWPEHPSGPERNLFSMPTCQIE